MQFYQFDEPNYLQPISTNDWIPFIQNKFNEKGLKIAEHYIEQISLLSSYQLNFLKSHYRRTTRPMDITRSVKSLQFRNKI